ncbi:hypothetical protein Cni_G15413 [Canna indica]|uniref:Uncharacterized protein n=1 Tax=Canna indica TaxID=4628 RepID=A0AAQ3KEF5_9LILI|nr:hypothetical protein Cni_G15413 [Canna indica]
MVRARNPSRRRRGSDDEDEEYVVGEEEEEDAESLEGFLVSDATEDEDEFEFADSSGGSEEEREIDYDDAEEDDDRGDADNEPVAAAVVVEEEKVEVKRLMPCNGRAKRSRVSVVADAEEDQRENGGVRSRRRNAVVLDYAEEEEDDDDRDEDFLPADGEDNDIDDEYISRDIKRSEKRRKSRAPGQRMNKRLQRMNKRLRRGRSDDDDDGDEDFLPGDGEDNDVDDEDISGDIKCGEKRRKSRAFGQKLKKRLQRGRSDDDGDFAVEYEPSESDFSCSDDGYVAKNSIVPHKRRKKIKNVERRRLLVVSDSSSDSDCMLMEGELKHLGDGAANPLQLRKIPREGEEKAKEKRCDDLGKQSCGICLSEEQKRTVQGKLDCCAHFFCFACIMEWSKVETRCPVCKRRFSTITKASQLDSEFGTKKVIRVQIRDQVYRPSEQEIRQMLDPYRSVVCTECQQGGDDSLMLLCDICDSCAHTYCVGLGREVPEGNWYCNCCRSATNGPSHLQNQGTLTDDGAHNNGYLTHGAEPENVAHIHDITHSRQSGSLQRLHSLQRIDLNAPPVTEDDYGELSPVTGVGASTLSGRRAIHQRIRILLSNSRPPQMFNQNDVLEEKVESVSQDVEQYGETSFHLD